MYGYLLGGGVSLAKGSLNQHDSFDMKVLEPAYAQLLQCVQGVQRSSLPRPDGLQPVALLPARIDTVY